MMNNLPNRIVEIFRLPIRLLRRQIFHGIFQRDKPVVFVVVIGKLFEQVSFIAIILPRKLNFAGIINRNKFSIESF